MWVFTTSGFYSVVRKLDCAPDELEVRGRCRKDLEVLKSKTGTKSKILTNAGTDYPFCIRMRRDIWAKFLADEAMKIDYPNFKDQVLFSKTESQGARKHRHDVYLDVWKAILGLSGSRRKKQRYSWGELEGFLEDDHQLIDGTDPDFSPGPSGTNTSPRKPAPPFRQSRFSGK